MIAWHRPDAAFDPNHVATAATPKQSNRMANQ